MLTLFTIQLVTSNPCKLNPTHQPQITPSLDPVLSLQCICASLQFLQTFCEVCRRVLFKKLVCARQCFYSHLTLCATLQNLDKSEAECSVWCPPTSLQLSLPASAQSSTNERLHSDAAVCARTVAFRSFSLFLWPLGLDL